MILLPSYILADVHLLICYFFFFNDTATTEIYTLSLHDALPISYLYEAPTAAPGSFELESWVTWQRGSNPVRFDQVDFRDRKSTRLNSSHGYISYAVFCLKKKNMRILSACFLVSPCDGYAVTYFG